MTEEQKGVYQLIVNKINELRGDDWMVKSIINATFLELVNYIGKREVTEEMIDTQIQRTLYGSQGNKLKT